MPNAVDSNQAVNYVLDSLKKNASTDSPEATATKLFFISANLFEKYNMDDRDNHKKNMAAMEEIRVKTQAQVKESILEDVAPEKISTKITYWTDTMEELLKKGDRATAASVRLVIDELAWSKQENLRQAFATLPTKTQDALNNYKVDARVTYLSTYENQHVTVPFMGIYPKILDMAKNAASLEDDPEKKKMENPGITKLRTFTQNIKANLSTQMKEEHKNLDRMLSQEQDNLNGMIAKVSAYNHQYEDSKNSPDQKKYYASHLLLQVMNNKSLTTEDKVRFLQNFIEQTPKGLEHKNFFHRISNKDFTIIKLAQEILPIMQNTATLEAFTHKNAKNQAELDEHQAAIASKEVVSQFVPGKIPQQPATPFVLGRKPINPEPEASKVTAATVSKEEHVTKEAPTTISPPPTSEPKENTVKLTSSFKEKLAFFESLIKKDEEPESGPRGPRR